MRSVFVSASILLLPFAAATTAAPVHVSSFSTVLTEIAEQVGGDRVLVTGHVKAGTDPHEFTPKPVDLKIVSEAQLILLSAKEIEGYVDKLQESAGARARVVVVGAQLSPPLRTDHSGRKEEGDPLESRNDVADPHWWQSIALAQQATRIVRDELTKVSPTDEPVFFRNAENYLKGLERLKTWAKSEIAKLPRDKRKLVTSHDAFHYFAQENGFVVYAVEGISSGDQPSSKKVADLIRLIKAQRVKAIFAEKIENPKVLQEITRETGAILGGELYADGLGVGDASTYEGMYRHNVSTIVNALL